LVTVLAWQRAAGPQEVCALCAIDESGRQRVLRLTNSAGLADAFEVTRSEEQIAAAAAEQRGWTIVAFVHTHPHDPPEMSPRDLRSFERDTLPWIIVGTSTRFPRQRSYTRPAGVRSIASATSD
jgi:proteasome lid subunit RPN8/RPN11